MVHLSKQYSTHNRADAQTHVNVLFIVRNGKKNPESLLPEKKNKNLAAKFPGEKNNCVKQTVH